MNMFSVWKVLGCSIALALFGIAVHAVPGWSNEGSCTPERSTRLGSSRQVAVYRLTTGPVFACDRRSGRRLRLRNAQPRFFRPRVAGRMVAFQYQSNDAEGITAIEVFDVRRRLSIILADVYTGSFNPHLEADEAVRDLVLDPDGAITWIAHRPDGVYEVRTVTPEAFDIAILDESADINPTSLAVTRRFIYWQSAGTAKVAKTLRSSSRDCAVSQSEMAASRRRARSSLYR